MKHISKYNGMFVFYSKYNSLQEASNKIKLNQGYSVICLFMNNFNFLDNKLNKFLAKLLDVGGIYFCVHGNNCSHTEIP